ncbi:helix-turn-helix domain-containing protein [Sphingomonas sp. TREG-RG-20F-R18-01]|uniref:GlxA family transcriptional regulator n=1 Tax=Sphingomonas sp. TREG-RG-20F-R18-01 TaxID=2914982 RepID=UPI001F5ABB91|nr:helix-turn-helix domain-containing protein [Sphingomonas sp. TREG-RG-20F-R18-01]
MHTVAVLALDGVVSFELGIACEVFGRVRTAEDAPAYLVEACSERPRVRTGGYDVLVPNRLDRLALADTVIVAGVEDASVPVSPKVLNAIHAAWANGARIASICTGAFVLAETGLLDGRRATTHWRAAADFARRFPMVLLDPAVLFVDEGRIVTSAGAMAGVDMCLHLVSRDHGSAIARHASRLAVAPLHRDGGQAQFIRHDPPKSDDSLASTLDWALAHLDLPLSVERLAARAAMAPRTFARRFAEQTGTTPHQWLLRARIQQAQELLETTTLNVDVVAASTGFGAAVTFRPRFQRAVGVSPQTYRRRFQGDAPRASALAHLSLSAATGSVRS